MFLVSLHLLLSFRLKVKEQNEDSSTSLVLCFFSNMNPLYFCWEAVSENTYQQLGKKAAMEQRCWALADCLDESTSLLLCELGRAVVTPNPCRAHVQASS